MALNGLTFDPVTAYGKGLVLLALKWNIVADTGAVASVAGKGFGTEPGVAGPNKGSVVKEAAAGSYTVTLPGTGSVPDIFVVGATLAGGDTDLDVRITSVDPTTRTASVQVVVSATGVNANVLSSGSAVHLTLLVKNTDVA